MAITERLTLALADRYRIERHLGAGGMATVFLAEDLKHKRHVALKVLKPELAAVLGAERFVQEITTTAALQHPHILPLFDSGTADGFLYYVMPFIEGETLRDKLNRETQFGIEESVRIAREVADALDYAHRHGVIHRDIKPENILLHDGRPMVADFGIALALSAAAGGRMTETGLSLGTPHYMSPEQATAEKEITGRSDVYSLGSVLYEMLTGEPPHMGNSAQQIIMKIVTDTARPVTELRKSVPLNVAAAVAKSIEKLPADRFESAAAFAAALANPLFGGGGATQVRGAAELRRAIGNRVTAALAIVAATSLAVAAWALLRPAADGPVSRFAVELESNRALAYIGNAEAPRLALTPDGRELVYPADSADRGRLLAVRSLDRFESRLLPGTDGARAPAVSWDGTRVAFVTGGAGAPTIGVASLRGGPPLTVVDSAFTSFPTWGPDGFVYFIGTADVVRRVAGGGGPIEDVVQLPKPGEGASYRGWLRILPGGRGALVSEGPNSTSNSTAQSLRGFVLRAIDLRTGRSGASVQGVAGEYVAEVGALVFVTLDQTLMVIGFDEDDLETRGRPQALFGGVDVRPAGSDFAMAGGTVAFTRTGVNAPEQVIWVRREGGVQEIVDPAWTDIEYESFALSPDGGRMAVTIAGTQRVDVWVKQLDRGPLSRLTFGGTENLSPAWSGDGRYVSYVSWRDGIASLWRRRADGVGAEERVAAIGRTIIEARWSRDGNWLAASVRGLSSMDLMSMRVGVDSALSPLLSESFDEFAPALSPDGRWLAYVSEETGRPEIFLRPFPGIDDGKWQISSGGAYEPVWNGDGRELFFRSEDGQTIMVADLSRGPALATRRSLLRASADLIFEINGDDRMFEPVANGQRFLLVRQGIGDVSGSLVIVQNFITELRAALAGGARP